MSHSIENRYIDQLEVSILNSFELICTDFDKMKKKYSECCLGESRTSEKMESLKQSLDILCGKAYQMRCYVSDLHTLEKLSELCRI